MADYYEVESKRDGSFTVTPRNNPGCLSGFLGFLLLFVIIFFVSRCDGGSSNQSVNNNSNAPNPSNIGYHDYQNDVTTEATDVFGHLLSADGTANLFEIPASRIKQDSVDVLAFSKYEHADLNGHLHQNCYMLCCEGNKYWITYDLQGEFKKLTGRLYAQNEGAVCWLEFYDGDTLIQSTPSLSESNVSCEVEINVSNVEFLTIYLCTDDNSGWLIAEDFVITK